jgi:hypothetical protein
MSKRVNGVSSYQEKEKSVMVRTICVSTNLHYKSFVEVGTIKIVQKQEGNQSDISYKSVLQNKKKHKETGH